MALRKMDEPSEEMDNPISLERPSIERRAKYFHTPARNYGSIFHAVLTAGHARLAEDYPLTSWSHPGHDLVLGVEGRGSVQLGSRIFKVMPGDLVWGDCNTSSISWPRRSEPWTIYWMRVDSAQMSLLAEALGVAANPVFTPHELAPTIAIFGQVLTLMRERPLVIDAKLNASVAALIAILLESRLPPASDLNPGRGGAAEGTDIRRVLQLIRQEYQRRWTVRELANALGASEPVLFRRFRQVTGSSPMDYLRRERINNAKRGLASSALPIAVIANNVGYSDPYYFSRDFRKVVGVSPKEYRQQERLLRR